jgi:excinuclease ABC subunit C
MEKADLTKKKLPSKPGVYFFLGKKKEILYIGKATTLSSRVRSYFDPNLKEKRSPVIEKMVVEAKNIEYTVTDSVLEAMLLEVNLIRTHKPVYNTKSKDDKSYNHLVITNAEFPQVLVVRGKDLITKDESEYLAVYGPFPNGQLFREALTIIRKLFKFYDVDVSTLHKSKMAHGKINFNRQIGLYPDSCTKEEYRETIRHIQLFFEGKKQSIITALEKSMHASARLEKFEEANVYKKRIFALKHIHDVSLIKDESREYRDDKDIRIEAYDIAHMTGKDMVGVMVVLRGALPEKNSYRKFTIKGFEGSNDPRALREVLERRFTHPEWTMPDLLVVDGSTAQKNVALQVLNNHRKTIPVVGVVKDDKHRPLRIIGPRKLIDEHKSAILLANAESHRFAITFHKLKRSKSFLT